MQQDRSAPVRAARRGRPRSFDLDLATAAALRTLWAKGFEATTIEDLVQATGLAPSSLYAAYGSKQGVLEAALARYDRDRDDLLAPLERGSDGVDDLRRFLSAIRQSLTEPGSPGCFMVNTATEVAAHDERIAKRANRYRERVREGIATALGRATAQGEFAPEDVGLIPQRARILQAAVYGVQVAARSGATDEALATVDALLQQIDQWAVRRSGR